MNTQEVLAVTIINLLLISVAVAQTFISVKLSFIFTVAHVYENYTLGD